MSDKKKTKLDILVDACNDDCEQVVLDKETQKELITFHRKMQQTELTDTAPVERTTRGLRQALFDELDKIREGLSDPKESMAIVKIANAVVKTAEVEIQFQNLIKDNPDLKNIKFLGNDG